MRRVLLLSAAVVVLAANAWALVAAWRNGAGPRTATMELTERELRLVEVPWESTVTLLDLRWDVLAENPTGHGPPAWFDAEKLAELGFDCTLSVDSPNAKEHYSAMPSALVFLVLEYEGEAWRQARRDRNSKTRLFVVDAGRDASRLRDRYADTAKYVIVRGVVRLSYKTRGGPDNKPLATPRLQGRIEDVLPSEIFVPRPFSRNLEPFRRRGPPSPEPPEAEPRYAVTVSWGSNHEPRVLGVRPLTPDSPGNSPGS